jgi:hypothetical protein
MAVARAFFEPLRSIAFGGISGAYAAVGTPTSNMIRQFCISNNTQGDMILSVDNTVAAGQMFVAAGGFLLIDVMSNMNPRTDDKFLLPIGTQFYIKQVTAPVAGNVYIQTLF